MARGSVFLGQGVSIRRRTRPAREPLPEKDDFLDLMAEEVKEAVKAGDEKRLMEALRDLKT